jgi:hypothetical protein
VLVWRVYDLIDAKKALHFNRESSFFRQLPCRSVRDALESMDLAPRQNPIAPLRIFVALS